MTPTKQDDALAALGHLEACLDGCYAQHEINIIRAALTHPPVDVEALKRGPANEDEAMCQVTSIYNDGWNHCIDDLVSKGYLK